MIKQRGSVFNCLLVSLSGVIGVGKSTLIHELVNKIKELLLSKINLPEGKHLEVVVVQEPVDEWRSKGWLQDFYANPEKNALAFQMLVYKTHIKAIQGALERWENDPTAIVVCITERSMWDQLLFWKLQVELGRDVALADDAYMEGWSLWKECIPLVSRIFYCKTSTLDQTLERIKLRGRQEEASKIDFNYHKLLREKHEDWYLKGVNAPRVFLDEQIPVTCINLDALSTELDIVLNQIAKEIIKDLKRF